MRRRLIGRWGLLNAYISPFSITCLTSEVLIILSARDICLNACGKNNIFCFAAWRTSSIISDWFVTFSIYPKVTDCSRFGVLYYFLIYRAGREAHASVAPWELCKQVSRHTAQAPVRFCFTKTRRLFVNISTVIKGLKIVFTFNLKISPCPSFSKRGEIPHFGCLIPPQVTAKSHLAWPANPIMHDR